ncbi:MAG: insulinase family protein [Muribaculaceae bacterium]|nr:insulinase family protein [Muribaculaceae bacterium]
MKLPQPTTVRFDSGLRLVHIQHHNVGAGIFGIVISAGSSDESSAEEGLAHFVEHTIFKGTQKRSSWHVINRMESVGGELNAFTTKEETTVYSIFPSGNAARAIELIADLALNSRFPERELEKEREVVLDEIYSYRDTPSEAVFDDFEDMVFKGSPLGHNILGTPESVTRLSSEDCRGFLGRYYYTTNVVAFYSGPENAARISKLVEKHFAAMRSEKHRQERAVSVFVPANKSVELCGLHQSHVVLGIPAASFFSDRKYADSLFSNLIGGPGMNSLLNVELRERRGLVYNVESAVDHFSSVGLLTVYFGCDAEDTDRCIKICKETLGRLAEMPEGELSRLLVRAKRQYSGQRAVASENRENRIIACARAMLYMDKIAGDDAVSERINAVSTDDIRALAAQMSVPSSLIMHP